MTNPCGCNWKLGHTCEMHVLEDWVTRLEAEKKTAPLTPSREKLLNESREKLATKREQFTKYMATR